MVAIPSIVADVLVLGAGPGGGATALHLERLGIGATVLEARGVAATRPNVVDLSAEAVESMRRSGADGILDGRIGPSTRGGTGAAVSLRVLEDHQRELLAARGVEVVHGARVTGLEQASDGLQHLRLEDGRTAAARYVVNATGGRSGIEEQLGMGLRFQGDWSWFGAARTPHVAGLEDGTRLGGLLGLVRSERADRFGELRPHFEQLALPPDTERWRSTMWYGWQNELDGMSMFQNVSPRDIATLTPAELSDRLLAPARAQGMQDVLDAPRLIRAESAVVERARSGSVLAVGDAAGRTHPKRMAGTQLALLDGERAAHAVADALKRPAEADAVLGRYDEATRAAHAELGHDGTRVLDEDPLRHLGRDSLELDGLDAWPTAGGPVA